MPKTKISEFSATPANNTDIDSINIAENCPPSGINDAIRELMAQLKDFQTGAVGDSFNGPVGTTTAAAGAFTTLAASGAVTLSGGTANGVAYLNGSKVVTSGSALTFDGTSVTASQFLSNGFTLADNTDITKKALFDLSGITTATTRTYTLPDVTGTVALLSGTQTFTSATTFSTTTGTLNLGTSLTTGVLTIGGTASTGNLVLGRSTATQTTSIQAGATASGSTKTINFGTGGLSGSTTAITIGSSVSGATSTITTNGTRIWSIEGSEQMRLTSTGLGIGTSSPSNPLHIVSNTVSQLNVAALSGNTNAQINFEPTGTGIALIGPANNVAFAFRTNATERLRISADGNLGLGVTPTNAYTSTKSFEYQSGGIFPRSGETNFTFNATQNSGASWIYGATNSASLFQIKPASFVWQIAGSGTAGNAITFTQAMTLLADGKLCLGATSGGSAGADFTLADTNSLKISFNGGAANFYGISKLAGGGNLGDGEFKFTSGNTSAGAFTFSSGGSERCRIDSSGNLLVGATTAHNFGIPSIQAGGSNANAIISVRRDTTSAADQVIFYNPNGSVGSISTNTSATSYNTSSDYRLKNTIAPMTGALAKVALLKPCTYKWNADGSEGEGFIAHELAEVCPDAVTGEKDAVDAEGNPKYQGIDVSFLVATLTAALQEQQAIIESLKARLDAANL